MAEPMDIDDLNEYDKENSLHRSNVLPHSSNRAYEELDSSEMSMKLRYSFTPASSPMSKSVGSNLLENSCAEGSTIINESNLSQSLNLTLKNDTFVKLPKSLPLIDSSSQSVENNRNTSVLRTIDQSLDSDKNNVTVTNYNDDNLSLPSTSSSPCTPEATTPVKDDPKNIGSPIMRGLKSVLSMFRPSQSPIPSDNMTGTVEQGVSPAEAISPPLQNDVQPENLLASTPLSREKKPRDFIKSQSKENITFNENFERELEWKDDSSIIFDQERIPIHKLLYPQHIKNICDNESNFNDSSEPMEISYNDSKIMDTTMTDTKSNSFMKRNSEPGFEKDLETDKEESLFLDCETTFTMNESNIKNDNCNMADTTVDLLNKLQETVDSLHNSKTNDTLSSSKSVSLQEIEKNIQENNKSIESVTCGHISNLTMIKLEQNKILESEQRLTAVKTSENVQNPPQSSETESPNVSSKTFGNAESYDTELNNITTTIENGLKNSSISEQLLSLATNIILPLNNIVVSNQSNVESLSQCEVKEKEVESEDISPSTNKETTNKRGFLDNGQNDNQPSIVREAQEIDKVDNVDVHKASYELYDIEAKPTHQQNKTIEQDKVIPNIETDTLKEVEIAQVEKNSMKLDENDVNQTQNTLKLQQDTNINTETDMTCAETSISKKDSTNDELKSVYDSDPLTEIMNDVDNLPNETITIEMSLKDESKSPVEANIETNITNNDSKYVNNTDNLIVEEIKPNEIVLQQQQLSVSIHEINENVNAVHENLHEEKNDPYISSSNITLEEKFDSNVDSKSGNEYKLEAEVSSFNETVIKDKFNENEILGNPITEALSSNDIVVEQITSLHAIEKSESVSNEISLRNKDDAGTSTLQVNNEKEDVLTAENDKLEVVAESELSAIIDVTNRKEIVSGDEEVIASENNSPFTVLHAETGDAVEIIKNIEVVAEKLDLSPPKSPALPAKGYYNFNFDDLENPFATKTKLSMSPPRRSSLEVSNNVEDLKILADCESLDEHITKSVNIKKHTPTQHKSSNPKRKSVRNSVRNKTVTLPKSDVCSEIEKIPKCDSTLSSNSVSKVATETSQPISEGLKETSSSELTEYSTVGMSLNEDVLKNETSILPHPEQNINPFETIKDAPLPDKLCEPLSMRTKVLQTPEKEIQVSAAKTPAQVEFSVTDTLEMKLTPTSPECVPISNGVKNSDKIVIQNDLKSKPLVLSDDDISNNDQHQFTVPDPKKITDEINATFNEFHTDDEDTLEGPFIESRLVEEPENKVFMADNSEIPHYHIQDPPSDNEDGCEMFINADDFDFLMNQNKTSEIIESGKESLFMKFDPLFSKRVNSEGVVDLLSKIQKKQSTPKKLKKPDLISEHRIPVAGSSAMDDILVEEPTELLVASQKPTMAVPPVNAIVTPKRNVPSSSRLSAVTSPAINLIDRLLSTSFSNTVHETTIEEITATQYDTSRALTELRELLAQKELDVDQLRSERKDLEDRLGVMESQIKALETDNEKKLKSIKELTATLEEKTKISLSMTAAVEEYERTISAMTAGLEEDKKRNAAEKAQLAKERDEQSAHLASMELAFNDLHSKYEKSKQVILSYKANENAYKKKLIDYEDSLVKMEANYESLKQHATSKLNQSNLELQKIKSANESEVLKLNAMIKRKDLHISSLEETLAQKTKANDELTAICDELINKVG